MSSVPNNTWTVQLREWISSPLGILAMTFIVGYIAYMNIRREHPTYDDEDYEKEGHATMPAPLKNLSMTKEQLGKYDSRNSNGTYLVALMGVIYDVSCAPHDFGPNGGYDRLAGTDIMWYIQSTARFESRDFATCLREWKIMLEDHFYEAGVLIEEKSEGSDDNEYDSAADEIKDDQKQDNETHAEKEVSDVAEGVPEADVPEAGVPDADVPDADVQELYSDSFEWTDVDATLVAT